MEAKKQRGRPPGPRKDAVNLYIRLASDVVAIADQHVPQYGSRTASIEALVRLGERWSAAAAGAPLQMSEVKNAVPTA